MKKNQIINLTKEVNGTQVEANALRPVSSVLITKLNIEKPREIVILDRVDSAIIPWRTDFIYTFQDMPLDRVAYFTWVKFQEAKNNADEIWVGNLTVEHQWVYVSDTTIQLYIFVGASAIRNVTPFNSIESLVTVKLVYNPITTAYSNVEHKK